MRRAFLGTIVVLFGIAPGVARADTIRITSGSVTFDNDPLTFTLSGSGFHLQWDTFSPTPDIGSAFRCYPCSAGSTSSMSAEFSGSQLGESTPFGEPTSYLGGHLSLASDSITIPDDLTHPSPFENAVTRPFTMTGTLLGFGDPSRSGTPLFDHDLTGSGHVTLFFVQRPTDPPHTYATDIWSFDFENAATTPEPTSLLLLGTGLAFCLMRRRAFGRHSTSGSVRA